MRKPELNLNLSTYQEDVRRLWGKHQIFTAAPTTTTLLVGEIALGDGLGLGSTDVAYFNADGSTITTLSQTVISSAYKTADESVSSSITVQDDNHLSLSLAASTTYQFRFVLFTNNVGAAEGFRCTLGGTVGVTSLKAQISIYDDTANTLAAFARITALGSEIGSGLAAGNNMSFIDGSIETSTAGTFLLRWAQNVSGANNTTVERNSNLVVTRLS